MIQRAVAIGFLGYHFAKTLIRRLFRLRHRGLDAFREEYKL